MPSPLVSAIAIGLAAPACGYRQTPINAESISTDRIAHHDTRRHVDDTMAVAATKFYVGANVVTQIVAPV